METESGISYDEYGMRIRTGRDPKMVMEFDGEGGAEAIGSTSSGLSAVEEAAFNDSTPVEEFVPEGDDSVEEEGNSEEELETTEEHEEPEVEEDDADVVPANFTDLEAANKHIAKINRQDAAKRVALKEYNEVFGKFDPESKSALLGIVNTLASDPEAGARQLAQVAKNILGEDAFAPSQEIDEDQPLTMKQWKEVQAKEAAKQEASKAAQKAQEEAEQAVKAIFTKAEELGYKEAVPSRHLLLSIAAADESHGGTNGDLDKAHEKVQAYEQTIIDQYLAGKTGQRDAFPTTGEGAAPSESKGPKTWNDFIDQATEYAAAAENVGK